MHSKVAMSRCQISEGSMGGVCGHYVKAVSDHWLKTAPDANPAMLQMFIDRDRSPKRDLLPWSGEFAGKYLTSAVQVYRLTKDTELYDYLKCFVSDLIACQDTDGYLGPWPKPERLNGQWDAWGHYHIMMGLIMWYEETSDQNVLDCLCKIADLLCRRFLNRSHGERLVDIGASEMNLAPVHSLALLYKITQQKEYLDLALQIADEFEVVGADGIQAGDYIRTALNGIEFYETPKPRWESLHPIMGIAALYELTEDEKYKRAFEHIWWSIEKTDRHNNGGFSAGEQAQGTPYHTGAIETCCTIAWLAASYEMLKLTGNSVVADEIELSTLNSVIGMHSCSGRWVTYNTPMSGLRKASAHDIVFQAREGSPELNCCSVNGPRGFGMLSDWGFMLDDSSITINYFGESEFSLKSPNGQKVTIKQETDYPKQSHVRLTVKVEQETQLAVKIRIPYWSSETKVSVNEEALPDPTAGKYLELERVWTGSDVIAIDFDFCLHFWIHEEQPELASIYRGPILLTYDRRFNDMDPDDIPALDAANMTGVIQDTSNLRIEPVALVEFTSADNRKLRLCDFGSAGEGGTPYESWLAVNNLPEKGVFSPANPLRSVRTI